MVVSLPVFEGYVVDARLRQFRKVNKQNIEFVEFDSSRGEQILSRYIESLDPESQKFKRFIHYF